MSTNRLRRPLSGGGAPSDSFGGAANQAGHWNKVAAAGEPPVQLYGLDGLSTSVVCTGPIGGVGGGNNFSANTGDFALLLNDGRLISDGDIWRFEGIQAGLYQVCVYAVEPSDLYNPTPITVSSGGESQTLEVSGPMPGNQFILGATHQLFLVNISGPLVITAHYGPNESGWVNGFQIVPVPESGVLGVMLGGLGALLLRRQGK